MAQWREKPHKERVDTRIHPISTPNLTQGYNGDSAARQADLSCRRDAEVGHSLSRLHSRTRPLPSLAGMRRPARPQPVSSAASAGQPGEAGGGRRGAKASSSVLSQAGLRRLLKRWRNDPLFLYGLPSVLVLLLVLYLCLAPEPSQSSTTAAPRTPPLLLTSSDSRTCSPLSVEDDAELHMRLLRCDGRVIGGESLSATVSIFVRDYLLAAAALADTLLSSFCWARAPAMSRPCFRAACI
jgi:hypothetical protein